jgi:hypothetical protein
VISKLITLSLKARIRELIRNVDKTLSNFYENIRAAVNSRSGASQSKGEG